MVNKLIKEKILEENFKLMGSGIIMIPIGILLSMLFYDIGWIVYLFWATPIIGVGCIAYSIYRMFYFPSNLTYSSWNNYGRNDEVVDEIKELIENKEKDFQTKEFFISKGWLVKPKEFIFVKTKDVNWVYSKISKGLFSRITHSTDIMVFSKDGIKFDISCSNNKEKNELHIFMDVLKTFCKRCFFGHIDELSELWTESPEQFLEKLQKIQDSNSMHKQGTSNKTRTIFDDAIERNPKDATAWYNKGVALVNLGKYFEAINCFGKATAINPKDAATLYNKGVVLFTLGKYPEAIKYYDKSLKLNPEYTDALNNKGQVLCELEKYVEAMKCFDKVLTINPEDVTAMHNRGALVIKHGRHSSKDANELHDQGNSLFKQKKYAEAIKYYDKALKLNPEDVLAWTNKKSCVMQSRKAHQKIKVLQ